MVRVRVRVRLLPPHTLHALIPPVLSVPVPRALGGARGGRPRALLLPVPPPAPPPAAVGAASRSLTHRVRHRLGASRVRMCTLLALTWLGVGLRGRIWVGLRVRAGGGVGVGVRVKGMLTCACTYYGYAYYGYAGYGYAYYGYAH